MTNTCTIIVEKKVLTTKKLAYLSSFLKLEAWRRGKKDTQNTTKQQQKKNKKRRSSKITYLFNDQNTPNEKDTVTTTAS